MNSDRQENSSSPSPETDYLIQRFLDEELDSSELERLDALCEKDPDLYRRLFDHFLIDQHLTAVRNTFQIASRLNEQGSTTAASPSRRTEPVLPSRKEIVRNRWIAASALLVLAFLGIVVFFEWNTGSEKDSSLALATVVDLADPVWKFSEQPLKLGQQLQPGVLALESGMLALLFTSGTHVVLQGPVELVVKDVDQTFCGRGRMSVTVPPAGRGFTVHTPFSSVVDLGTEFYLDVGNEQTDVHVRTGTVEIDRTRLKRFSLEEGVSALARSDGTVTTGTADRELFVEKAVLKERSDIYRAKLNEEIRIRRSRFADDPTLAVEFHFDRLQGDSVVNLAKASEKAWLIGCRTEKDRFSEEKAVVFRKGSDRIEWAHAGRLNSMTLVMTLRIDANRHPVSRLLLARRFYEEAGYFLWQINRSGDIQFHLHVDGAQRYRTFDVPGAVAWSDRGTWTTWALVADAEKHSITHYKDGRPLASFAWNDPSPLLLDEMTLGNEIPGRRKETDRFLDGAVRNFMLFSRALSENEIADLSLESFQ